MKFTNHFKLLSAAAFGLAIGSMSCTDNTFTYDESWIDDERVDSTEQGGQEDPGEEPTYSFQTMSKTVKINPDVRYQVLDGIGASDAWLPNKIGQYWTSKRNDIATLLFSQEIVNGQPKGIGLSTWRFNLGAGSEEQGDNSGISAVNNRMPSFVNGTADALVYDWNKCPGQRFFLQKAKEMGVESFVLFSNSPLVQYTKNGKAKSGAGARANIKDEYFDDYAEYMATVADHFVKEGYNISHISPVNEPQFNWNGDSQEGSGWQNSQVATLARELQKALDAKGISTKISLGETDSYKHMYGGADGRENTLKNFMSEDGNAYVGDLSRLDNIAGHSYWTDGNWKSMREHRATLAETAKQYNAKVWQTEWSMLASSDNHYGDNLSGTTTAWDIAQYMTEVMHNDFVVGGVTAWHYWTAMSIQCWSQLDRFMLINCVPGNIEHRPGEGNVDADFTQEGYIEPYRTLWALGNYSLFVRPGYQRIDLNMIDSESFFGNGWISPDGKTIVCVYTNRQAERGVKLKVDYHAFPSMPTKVMTYTTTETKDLQGKEWSTNWPVVCEPSSVTTVVYTL